MTSQSGGGGSVPGMTPDGLTPPGITVAGTLTAGDPAADTVPSFNRFNGSVLLVDTVATNVDGDILLLLRQQAALSDDSFSRAHIVRRSGALNGHDYLVPVAQVDDTTASTAPLHQWTKLGVTQFQVDGDGVQVHGKIKTGSAVAHVLGAYSGNAVPIYDEAGTLLGYMPLYA